MEPTLIGGNRIILRGGTLEIVGGRRREPLRIGPEPRIVGRSEGCDLVLEDKQVSKMHMDLAATELGVRVRDLGSRNGTFVGDHRVAEIYLTTDTTLRAGRTLLAFAPTKPEKVKVSASENFGPLVGSTPQMRALFEKLRVVSKAELAVLILGETGTGKELVAHAIHAASKRASKPFVVVDCGAIPSSLAESILFGHERGAFTGAVSKRISPFVEAAGGTVFLDEIGELPLEMQPKLLRVLADQRIKSLGANEYQSINVRVLAATHRDIMREVNEGTFRGDLYFRVAQVKVDVPPLRERKDDITGLVARIMDDLGASAARRRVDDESLERLRRHDWPGNVRELKNLVALAIAYDEGGPIDIAAHLTASESAVRSAGPRTDRTLADVREEVTRAYLSALHLETGGNLSEIARRAGVDRKTAREHVRRLRLGR
jgi:DNA-binding NtrC family response regulator